MNEEILNLLTIIDKRLDVEAQQSKTGSIYILKASHPEIKQIINKLTKLTITRRNNVTM